MLLISEHIFLCFSFYVLFLLNDEMKAKDWLSSSENCSEAIKKNRFGKI